MGNEGIQIASAGIACLAVGALAKESAEVLKSRRDSPWSYVLSLKQDLGSDNFLKSLLKAI